MCFVGQPYREENFRSDRDFDNPFNVSLTLADEAPHQRTLDWLRGYNPPTQAMLKAKHFWLKAHKYSPQRETLRQQYPAEAELIRAKLWKRNAMNCAESAINHGYHYKVRHHTQPPEEFHDLAYYTQLEPDDRATNLSGSLKYFLNVSEADSSRFWKLDAEGLNRAQTHYPNRVDRLRELLWQRHIVLEENRQPITLEEGDARIYRLHHNGPGLEEGRVHHNYSGTILKIVGTVCAVASAVLFSTSAFLSLPWICVPGAICLIAACSTPIIYHYRNN